MLGREDPLLWSCHCKVLRIYLGLKRKYLFFTLTLLIILSKQTIVSLQILERQSKPRKLTIEQAGFPYRLPIVLETFCRQSSCYHWYTEKWWGFFSMMKKQTPDFQERNGIGDFSFYTITFSRCKSFHLGSHLLEYYELSSKWVKLALPYPFFSSWKVQSRISVAAVWKTCPEP